MRNDVAIRNGRLETAKACLLGSTWDWTRWMRKCALDGMTPRQIADEAFAAVERRFCVEKKRKKVKRT